MGAHERQGETTVPKVKMKSGKVAHFPYTTEGEDDAKQAAKGGAKMMKKGKKRGKKY